MMKIKLKNPGELNALLSAADYEKFVAEEGGQLDCSHQRQVPNSLESALR